MLFPVFLHFLLNFLRLVTAISFRAGTVCLVLINTQLELIHHVAHHGMGNTIAAALIIGTHVVVFEP